MQATNVLRDEHQGILAMLSVVETAAYRVREGKEVPADLFLKAADFFHNFADECHHGKEELELFPALVARGIPDRGGPIGMMLSEHAQGRELIRRMTEAAERFAHGDQLAAPALAQSALGYVELLRAHIQKENTVLFPMADRVLSDGEQDSLYAAFDRIEKTHMGPGVHERYHAMIGDYQRLAATWERVSA